MHGKPRWFPHKCADEGNQMNKITDHLCNCIQFCLSFVNSDSIFQTDFAFEISEKFKPWKIFSADGTLYQSSMPSYGFMQLIFLFTMSDF